MMAIFFKELRVFFSSIIGIITFIVFFVAMALIVFVFPETSVLDFGYANLDTFFNSAPYVLLFLIPAITMRSFAEEQASQTIELLRTKPLSFAQIIGGKFLSAATIVSFLLLPILVFVFIISKLAEPVGNIDIGGIAGSYIGLYLLALCFVAIGLFASSLSKNQIVAFVVAVFLCFAMYFVFSSVGSIPWLVGKGDYFIQQFGLQSHYDAMSRGVVSLSGLIYFLSVVALFLWLTFGRLKWQEL